MKFSIAKEHRDFFQKHGFIEFEKIFNETQITDLNSAIDYAISKKVNKEHLMSEQLFQEGRDLWRYNEQLKKLISHHSLVEVMAQLFDIKPIRLGYDQLFPSISSSLLGSYEAYIKKPPLSLVEISSVKGILGGALISLSETDYSDFSIFPHQLGNVTFIHPEAKIDFQEIFKRENERFYLVIFTENKAFYSPNPNDSHPYDLKNWGYTFNDYLKDKLNPIVYR